MSNAHSPARPSTVTASFYLWLITVLIGLIGGVILLVVAGSATAAGATDTSAGLPTSALIVAAVIAIVLSIVQLIIVFQMRAGKNWARIVLLILAILQVVSALTTGGGSANWSTWVGLVAVVIATVLMFLPASNPYFRRSAA